MPSTAVVADDRHIEKAVQKLVALLQGAGAALADGLVIRCAAGNLSIDAPRVRHGARLIRMPVDCLVPLIDIRPALVAGEIVISSAKSRLKESTVAIAEAMFEIYNLAGKVSQHRRTSPWSLIASYPDLMSYITPPSRDELPFSAKDIRAGNDQKVMLASFLHSRLFRHKQSEAAKPRPVLLPITDFLNHHWQGEPYSYDSRRAVVMRRSAPLPGKGDECFASYGLHDAYDTWIAYGFVDEDVPFVQSVSMTLDVPRVGTIRCGHVPLHRESSGAGPSAQQLRSYLPRILARRGKHLSAAALIIPGPQAPRALRRALRMLIGEIGAPRQQQTDLVRHAEEQVLGANLAYYRELKSCLERLSVERAVHASIRANFVRLCEGQVCRLRNYPTYAAG